MAEPADRLALASLVDASEDDLLLRLADQVALGVGPVDPTHKRAIARAWLDAQEQRLRDSVRGDARIQAMRGDAATQTLELAAAICDLVSAIVGALPASTVTMLLIRRGLDRLCE